MRLPATLSARFAAIGSLLLLAVLSSIGITLWVTWNIDGGAAAVNEAGRMRMQTWRLAQTLSAGESARIEPLAAQFEYSLELLRRGDPSRPLFVPRDERSQAEFTDVQRGWRELRAQWSGASPQTPAQAAAQAGAYVERIDRFVTAIETRLTHWTALLNALQFANLALALASAVALLYFAYLFIFNPLSRLQAGLASVGEGDLSARVEIFSDDEFGTLSRRFNHMANALQTLYQSLETRVEEKTLRLETERARLAELYEAAAFVAGATSLDELAKGFAKQFRRVARADASAVRWSDESNQRYLLLASDCLPMHIAQAEHCLPTGGCFCGQPQEEASTRVIPIHAETAASMPGNCARAGFETLVSVPVRLHERMVGELNLFYRRTVELDEDDQALLEALATHLAGAIEGLRTDALQRESAVAQERSLLARELHDSIAQGLSFLKIQTGLLREARRRDDALAIERSLAELDEGIRESLADVRELLVHFRTRTNAEDIALALRATLKKFEHQTGLSAHLSIETEGMPLPPDVQVQVLHVVQEALSNVRKHARAREVWVEVQQAPQWRVEVRDDGQGFEAGSAVPDETHVGLRIMRERAERIGAEVEVVSVPGSGTCVVLTLPMREAAAA